MDDAVGELAEDLGSYKAAVRKLADACGVTTNTVYRWRAGKNIPQAHFLPIVAEVVGWQVEEFFRDYDSLEVEDG